MKRKIQKIVLSFLFVNFHIFAVIVESNNLQDIYKYVDKNTAVIFDIDNTIVEASIDFDSWIPYRINELVKKGLDKKDSTVNTLNTYYVLQQFVDLKPIGNSKKIISDLQRKKITVFALTNRSIPVLKRTLEQMKAIGINFLATSPSKKDINLAITHSAKFSKGIVFSASNDKGQMLFTFLDAIKYKPSKVVFVDDKLKNVKSVEKEVENHGIPYVGIRFSLQDKKKKELDFDQLKKNIHKLKIKIGIEPLNSKI